MSIDCSIAPSDLQQQIVPLGRELFTSSRLQARTLNPLKKIDDAVMGLLMRDPAVSAQLFRFVDALPSLRTSQQVARHLAEYLSLVSNRLSWPMRLPTLGIGQTSLGSAVTSAAARWNVRRMARRFIAAADVEEAGRAIAALRRQHLAATLDVLGEAVISETEADAYQAKYLQLLEVLPSRIAALPQDDLLDIGIDGPIPRLNLSIKLSSLFSQFDPIDPNGAANAVLARLNPILRKARAAGAFINLDMENYALKDLTLEVFRRAFSQPEFADWPDVGIAIQAYLRDTTQDLHDLADWAVNRPAPVWVRLVKGAYWDYETVIAEQNGWPIPVFTDKAETDASYESNAAFLLENRRVLHPALATHNIRTLAASLAIAQQLGLRPRDVEFQMLHGMAGPIKSALAASGHRVRVYAPVGQLLPGMAYLVRRLLENTSNDSFLRAGFFEHVPEEKLLMDPKTVSRSSSPRASTLSLDGDSANASGDDAKNSSIFRNESPIDFSLPDAHRAMADAIAEVSAKPLPDALLFVDGKPDETGRWIESINPSHRARVIGRSACATPEIARHTVAVAKAALPGWRRTPASERAALLERVAADLLKNRVRLAAIEAIESAKPWRDADADVCEAIDFCRYYAQQMRELSREKQADIPGEQNHWLYEPRGVAVVIAPWNFPLAILTGMTAAAVVTGNPVIMKPAEQSPMIAAELSAAFQRCGAPAGVVNFLPGIGEEIGPVLIKHPDVAMIVFTGSRAVGLQIAQSAATPQDGQTLVKRVITEMGGKNAIIIDDDADLDEAVAGVVASAFGYSGQKCSAASRVIVLPGVYDEFLPRLIEATRSLTIADAEDPACKVGPVIDAEALVRIRSAIEKGTQEATLAYAGDVDEFAEEGFFIAPHIFTEVSPTSSLAQQEIFGPVLSVLRADNLDHAITFANDVKYALTGGFYSRSPENIRRVSSEFLVGDLYINRRITGALVGRQPFGGFKLSGSGTQAGGPDYLRHFVLPRCVTENTLRRGFTPAPTDSPSSQK